MIRILRYRISELVVFTRGIDQIIEILEFADRRRFIEGMMIKITRALAVLFFVLSVLLNMKFF